MWFQEVIYGIKKFLSVYLPKNWNGLIQTCARNSKTIKPCDKKFVKLPCFPLESKITIDRRRFLNVSSANLWREKKQIRQWNVVSTWHWWIIPRGLVKARWRNKRVRAKTKFSNVWDSCLSTCNSLYQWNTGQWWRICWLLSTKFSVLYFAHVQRPTGESLKQPF